MTRFMLAAFAGLIALAAFAQTKPQQKAALQKQRTKVLDVAASTPFFGKAQADAVKRVISGGDARKATEEEALGGPQPQAQSSSVARTYPQARPTAQPTAAPLAPPSAPVFTARLIGITHGHQSWLASFQLDGRPVLAGVGKHVDGAKVISISRSRVVLLFAGQKMTLAPW